jgi:hypothetical protein
MTEPDDIDTVARLLGVLDRPDRSVHAYNIIPVFVRDYGCRICVRPWNYSDWKIQRGILDTIPAMQNIACVLR